MDPTIIESLSRGVERVGIPAGLIFAGLYLLNKLVRSVGPPVAGFLAKLTEKLSEHSIDHAKLDGKLDTHHERLEGQIGAHTEKTVAEIRKAAAALRSHVDSVRGDVRDAADRIIDNVRPLRGDDAPDPRSSRRSSPLDPEDTLQSEKDK